jgi:hypothetical protein
MGKKKSARSVRNDGGVLVVACSVRNDGVWVDLRLRFVAIREEPDEKSTR